MRLRENLPELAEYCGRLIWPGSDQPSFDECLSRVREYGDLLKPSGKQRFGQLQRRELVGALQAS